MADIEVVVKIPEEIYKASQIIDVKHEDIIQIPLEVIANGTPLPKGHGRLGDLDILEKLCTEHDITNSAYDNSPIIEQGCYSDGDCIWKPLFNFADTIIEADKY